jgi:hypothetical protein
LKTRTGHGFSKLERPLKKTLKNNVKALTTTVEESRFKTQRFSYQEEVTMK